VILYWRRGRIMEVEWEPATVAGAEGPRTLSSTSADFLLPSGSDSESPEAGAEEASGTEDSPEEPAAPEHGPRNIVSNALRRLLLGKD
jgi:hypothetical protein